MTLKESLVEPKFNIIWIFHFQFVSTRAISSAVNKGSWSLWALRLESDCEPLVKIYAILTLF